MKGNTEAALKVIPKCLQGSSSDEKNTGIATEDCSDGEHFNLEYFYGN